MLVLLTLAMALASGTASAETATSGGDGPPAGATGDVSILIRAAEVHVGDGLVHAPGAVLIEGDRIKAVGSQLVAPPGAIVKELPSAVLTPWLVDASVRVSISPAEGGMRSDAALLTASDARPAFDPSLPDLRGRGIAALVLVPHGGGAGLSGRTAAMSTADGSVLDGIPALTANLSSHGGSMERAAEQQSFWMLFEDAVEQRRKVKEHEATAAKPARDRPAVRTSRPRNAVGGPSARERSPDVRLSAAQEQLLAATDGTATLRVRVASARDATMLLDRDKAGEMRVMLAGCEACAGIAPRIAESRALVVVEPLRDIAADRESDGASRDLLVAGTLARAGARLAVGTGASEVHGAAWLRAAAFELASRGVPRADCVAAMTGRAAEAAGLRHGLLAADEPASFLAWDGDPLDPSARLLLAVESDTLDALRTFEGHAPPRAAVTSVSTTTAGLFDADSALGVLGRRDEISEALAPDLRVSDAFAPDATESEALRISGVTSAWLATGPAGVLGGAGALAHPAPAGRRAVLGVESWGACGSLSSAARVAERAPSSPPAQYEALRAALASSSIPGPARVRFDDGASAALVSRLDGAIAVGVPATPELARELEGMTVVLSGFDTDTPPAALDAAVRLVAAHDAAWGSGTHPLGPLSWRALAFRLVEEGASVQDVLDMLTRDVARGRTEGSSDRVVWSAAPLSPGARPTSVRVAGREVLDAQ